MQEAPSWHAWAGRQAGWHLRTRSDHPSQNSTRLISLFANFAYLPPLIMLPALGDVLPCRKTKQARFLQKEENFATLALHSTAKTKTKLAFGTFGPAHLPGTDTCSFFSPVSSVVFHRACPEKRGRRRRTQRQRIVWRGSWALHIWRGAAARAGAATLPILAPPACVAANVSSLARACWRAGAHLRGAEIWRLSARAWRHSLPPFARLSLKKNTFHARVAWRGMAAFLRPDGCRAPRLPCLTRLRAAHGASFAATRFYLPYHHLVCARLAIQALRRATATRALPYPAFWRALASDASHQCGAFTRAA